MNTDHERNSTNSLNFILPWYCTSVHQCFSCSKSGLRRIKAGVDRKSGFRILWDCTPYVLQKKYNMILINASGYNWYWCLQRFLHEVYCLKQKGNPFKLVLNFSYVRNTVLFKYLTWQFLHQIDESSMDDQWVFHKKIIFYLMNDPKY